MFNKLFLVLLSVSITFVVGCKNEIPNTEKEIPNIIQYQAVSEDQITDEKLKVPIKEGKGSGAAGFAIVGDEIYAFIFPKEGEKIDIISVGNTKDTPGIEVEYSVKKIQDSNELTQVEIIKFKKYNTAINFTQVP